VRFFNFLDLFFHLLKILDCALIYESVEKENDSFTMDETDSWAFLGESANLSDFNPKEVFSADDAIEGLQLSTDEENCINSRNDETMVENFFSHASHSSFKKS